MKEAISDGACGMEPDGACGMEPDPDEVRLLSNLYAQGRLGELEGEARRLSGRHPESGLVWKVLGVALMGQRRFDQALAPLRQAVRWWPLDREGWLNLAMTCQELDRPDEAGAAYRRTLELWPDSVDVHNNLGALLQGQGRLEEAESCFRRVLALQPDAFQSCHNLAGNLLRQGRLEEAEAFCDRTLALRPDFVPAVSNLGNLRHEQGRLEEAVACYRRVLALRPDDAAGHYNLGLIHQEQGRPLDAETRYRQAVALQPDYVAAWNNLGNLLLLAHRLAEAESCYQRILALRPDAVEAHSNLGAILLKQGKLLAAEASYRQALTLQPDCHECLFNLGNVLRNLGRVDEAEACFREVLRIRPDFDAAFVHAAFCAQMGCRWEHHVADGVAMGRLLERGVAITPLVALTRPELDGVAERRAGALYAEEVAGPLLKTPPLVDPRHHPGRERLRIGYLSADFRDHPVTQVYGSVIQAHDRERFAVYCYAYGPATRDAGRQRIVRACDHFRDLSDLSDRESAWSIVQDQIDILLDLTGYMQHCRPGILAQRPAPLLVNAGQPGSMGHPRLADYKIGDPIATPTRLAAAFSETLALLPRSFASSAHKEEHPRITRSPDPAARLAAGLPEAGFVFCSFNQSYKFSRAGFAVWCRLLEELPGSLLWLSRPNPVAMRNLRQEAGGRGIDPDRILFADRTPSLGAHLERLALADLALDTFPYTSQVTGCDTLWSGVPMITLQGETHVSRIAASLLHGVGLPDLITGSWEAYFALALDLARNPERLDGVRARLLGNRAHSPLFDVPHFVRDLERLLERMWRDHGAGKREPVVLERSAGDFV
ncbi:MAG: tetratricopeptide repeat protein [Magnetococcales bacterium]|nr:tetratricopeptide repeat protein [Magnetococcales bacterium]